MEEENKTKSEAALREEKVLEFWRENKIFDKTLEKKSPEGEFVFYDGPVTANSKPVLHTMVPFAFKDAIPRYRTMRGYHVRRKGGWDTHGLPVELQIEKKLGFKSKNDIENYGIAEFNKLCKDSVWEYVGFWKSFTQRMGYWADQENAYVTYHNKYIESLWNVVKNVHEQDLLYKDYKVVPWCPRCGTALSSHELAQGYETVKDLSLTAKFKIVGVQNGYFLAWTTTPWTLPGNVALAVGEDIDYVEIKVNKDDKEEILVLAKNRLSIIEGDYEIVAEHKGKEMVGMEYEPLFPFLKDEMEKKGGNNIDKAFKVYAADFVNIEDGTGIVHTAVMYGQDDFELGKKVGLPKFHTVNPEGKFVAGMGFLEGRYVKEVDDNGKPTLAVDIIKYLTEKNLFFKKENYEHQYPHCWRCHTPLIYYARDSWYIRMSDPKVKKQLIDENQKINWEPAYTRDGRFGEWLREIKDWAISRERYWGTPLPVWEYAETGEKLVAGSLADLKKYAKTSGNKYFMLRHGESEKNLANVSNSSNTHPSPLTPAGEERIKKSVKDLKEAKIEYIFVSPLLRTQQTAKIVAEALGIGPDCVVTDDRLIEIGTGELDGKPIADYLSFYKTPEERFTKAPNGGENLNDVKKRMGDFIYDIESKFGQKNILIVSHEDTIWMLESAAAGLSNKDCLYCPIGECIQMGEVRELMFAPLPHNENFELDLHKPYIDEIILVKDGKDFKRTKEVMDVWFDSGAMPFAQDHYPFENKEWVEGEGYPADFISEAIDQTRGWFYTLHAVGILMGRGRAYKNVICLGHLLDAKGKKMSKSIGNVVDPWMVMDKYGVDTLRMWMYSVNQPGESKNFDEKTVALLQQQVFGLLYNVLTFYELYRDKNVENSFAHDAPISGNVLDRWIITRLDELIQLSFESLNNYKLLEPARAIKDFIGDLSTWYLRRSRERIKEGDMDAKQTLYFVLKTLAKIMAPFAPFAAEDIWLRLRTEKDEESVHMSEWPSHRKVNQEIISNMAVARNVVSIGLEARQKVKIQIKQPISNLEIDYSESSVDYPSFLSPELLDLIKEEINVKKLTFKKNSGSAPVAATLDTTLTPELKAEGYYRELVRAIQDIRKKKGLTPSDRIKLSIETDDAGKKLIEKFGADMQKVVLASAIEIKENNNIETKTSEIKFNIKLEKE